MLKGKGQAREHFLNLTIAGGPASAGGIPAIRSDEELAIQPLTTKGISVHTAPFYDFTGTGYMVLSLMTPASEFA